MMGYQKKFTYLIADENNCFGVNYRINNVIIEDDIAQERSMNTLFQLMGRVGRVDKAWQGYVLLGQVAKNKLMDMILDDQQQYQIEARKFESIAAKLLNNKIISQM